MRTRQTWITATVLISTLVSSLAHAGSYGCSADSLALIHRLQLKRDDEVRKKKVKAALISILAGGGSLGLLNMAQGGALLNESGALIVAVGLEISAVAGVAAGIAFLPSNTLQSNPDRLPTFNPTQFIGYEYSLLGLKDVGLACHLLESSQLLRQAVIRKSVGNVAHVSHPEIAKRDTSSVKPYSAPDPAQIGWANNDENGRYDAH